MKPKWYWHLDPYLLCDLTEPPEILISYLKRNTSKKKENELMLRLLKQVKGKLPQEFKEVYEAQYKELKKAKETRDKELNKINEILEKELEKVYEAQYKAEEELNKVWYEAQDNAKKALDKERKTYKIEIEALHKLECPNCTWNGKSILA